MGDLQAAAAHGNRSNMSVLERWKNAIAVTRLSTFIIAAVLFIAYLFLLYGSSGKESMMHENYGYTESWPAEGIWPDPYLNGNRMAVVDPSPGTISMLRPQERKGFQLASLLPQPVKVTVDGKSLSLYTSEQTVIGVLQHFHIPIGPDDKVKPFLYTFLPDEQASISIVRIKKVEETAEEPIPFQIVEQADSKLLKGVQKTVQNGQNGVLQKTIEKVYEDGKLVAQNVIGQTVKAKSVNKIVAIGTAKPVVALSSSSPEVTEVTKGGVTFGVKRVLENVVLSAYSAGVQSTGKSKDDPKYGITYSGARVQEGHTVAVDPKVIPLGWWIYIDGYGFRKAEDIGSGVKGKWVDIYYDSEKFAQQFGLKKGATVYIVGPKKPSAD